MGSQATSISQTGTIWTESELVNAARTDRQAFAALYDRYQPRVFAYLLTYAPSYDDATDLTQHVFLRVLERLPAYTECGAPFSSWLFRIARNAAIDAYRRQRRLVPWDHLSALPEESADRVPDVALARREALERLGTLVAALPREQADLLALRFAAGLTTAEIAGLLGKSESAVRKQLWRTIRRLQERYGEHDV